VIKVNVLKPYCDAL